MMAVCPGRRSHSSQFKVIHIHCGLCNVECMIACSVWSMWFMIMGVIELTYQSPKKCYHQFFCVFWLDHFTFLIQNLRQLMLLILKLPLWLSLQLPGFVADYICHLIGIVHNYNLDKINVYFNIHRLNHPRIIWSSLLLQPCSVSCLLELSHYSSLWRFVYFTELSFR